MKFQYSAFLFEWTHERTEGWTEGWMDGQAQGNKPLQLLQSWGHTKTEKRNRQCKCGPGVAGCQSRNKCHFYVRNVYLCSC